MDGQGKRVALRDLLILPPKAQLTRKSGTSTKSASVVSPPPAVSVEYYKGPEKRSTSSTQYAVQVASFTQKGKAEEHQRSLKSQQFNNVEIKEKQLAAGKKVYSVTVGNFEERMGAEQLKTQLSKEGINGFIVTL